jgi:ankyrin repeat protein
MFSKSLIGALSISAMLTAGTADTRIADAAMQGDQNTMRALLQQKVDVNAAQGDGMTALHWAATKSDLKIVQMLLQSGANVKATTRINAQTPLFMACKSGNAPTVEALLKASSDANALDVRDTTPLMMAAASGNAEAVELLLAHGAAVNAKEAAHGQTALMFAAALNRDAAIKVLLAHGADPSLATRVVQQGCGSQFGHDGCAAVDENGDPLPEEKPAEAGKNPNPKSDATSEKAVSADKTALNAFAVSLGFKSAEYRTGGAGEDTSPESKDLRSLVQTLVAKVDELEKRLPGKAENGRTRYERAKATVMGGMTALLFAAREGHLAAARALLESGADINQVSPADKTSPLVMAIMNGHYDLAKFFLDYSADPKLANNLGLTPLYATIDVQWAPKAWFPQPVTGQENITYLDLIKALLEDGADPNARLGKKLWFRAFGDHSWVDTAGATAFWRAAQSSDLDALRLLVAQGADPNLPNSVGDTPLMVAAGIGWGANYSVNAPDSWMAAVKYCVQLGADVNATDEKGYTPLHGAAYIGNNEMINYLIEKGADVKAVAKDKNTVADMANGPTRFGIPHPDTVALLEKLGSANSHNCRSDQCLVAPKEDKKPTTTSATKSDSSQ